MQKRHEKEQEKVSVCEVKVKVKTEVGDYSKKTLHYEDDGKITLSRECNILNKIVEDAIHDLKICSNDISEVFVKIGMIW